MSTKYYSIIENLVLWARSAITDFAMIECPGILELRIRQSLGAVLLEAGRPGEAEAIYWQDLIRNRENGWSLYGLMQSLRAQGKQEQADMVENRFKKAWSGADITLTASRLMGETNGTLAAVKAGK